MPPPMPFGEGYLACRDREGIRVWWSRACCECECCECESEEAESSAASSEVDLPTLECECECG